MTRSELIEGLRWLKFPLLNDGFVCLVDVMGDDESIVQAARVSYGKDTRDGMPTNQPEIDGGNWGPDTALDPEQVKKNRDLIRYMMRHHHGTPLEMCEIKLLIRIPMDAHRQLVRHRTANINEYSTRYTEAIDSAQTTEPDEWRLQSVSNKQGSSGFLDTFKRCMEKNQGGLPGYVVGEDLSGSEYRFHKYARQVYQERLDAGVAREQARKDLPLSTYTELYWKCDLRNILHFLGLRMDSHAQKEIREYATVIGEKIVAPLFPLTWEAFQDYQFQAMSLSRLEIQAIKFLASGSEYNKCVPGLFANKRELEECCDKLKRLGLLEKDAL